MTIPLRIVTGRVASNVQRWVYIDMSCMKCDLCGVDDAVQNGVLCSSCREAIVRLLAISNAEQCVQYEVANATIATVDHPERTQNMRKARS